MNFVINKYGSDKVVNLGAFQYIWAKGAIKDIGRVLGIPFDITNEMTSYLDNETISEVIELGLLDKYKDKYPELFIYAEKLAGLPKSFGSHPCGRVITMNDVVYYNAIDINDNGETILQGDMHTADDLGLIKADFLGLRTVDVIYDTLDLIGKDYEYIAPHNLNFNDKKVWDNFRNGFTSQVFQFESSGMKETLKKIDCSCIEDLTVANALYRPGSMKYIDNYANRKAGIESFEYLHSDLEPILKNTYGIIVFQEQLIEIGRLAKLSNPDELRKATAKKQVELLDKIKPELFNGLKARGWFQTQLEQLWEDMLDFAKYSFNKSHAAAYALIAYICMYLKTHHTKEFITSCINSVSDKTEKVKECVTEAIRMGLSVINGSYIKCSPITIVYKNGIMMGTNSIKFCNEAIANDLTKLIKIKKYKSFIDLLDDIDNQTQINTKQLIILTGLNFFSDFGCNKYLLEIIKLYNGVKDEKTKKIILPSIRNCKQIKKDKFEIFERYGITEYIIQKYSNKETPKQYSEIDNIGLLSELMLKIPNNSMSIIEQVKFEKEYLQYIVYSNPSVADYYYIVVDFVQYKNTTKPHLVLRNIKTGEEIKTRIKQGNLYRNNPFGEFSILAIHEFVTAFKKKIINGNWVVSDETEIILEEWEVIK